MTPKSEDKGKPLSTAEVGLANIQNLLETADKDLLFKVRTRFDGLVNAYECDPVAFALLNLLMGEHLTKRIIENRVTTLVH